MPDLKETTIVPSSFSILKSKTKGEPFWLITTEDQDKYSCWNDEVVNELKTFSGKSVTIVFTVSEDGKYKNIQRIKEPVSQLEKFAQELDSEKQKEYGNVPPEVWEEKDKRIVRMSALRSAVDWAGAQLEADKKKKITTSDLLKVAQVFEAYCQIGETPQQLKEKKELEEVAEEVFEEN